MSEIAKELNVDALVEGSVQHAGDNVRVRLQLIDVVPEEQNLWGQTYERANNDVLIMCSEMARAIADEIRVELTTQEEAHLASARQVNQEAYDAYLKGLFHLYKFVPPEIQTARQYFESALEIDPNYAQAHAGIAMVWACLMQMGVLPASEATPKAKEALRKAQALDDTLAEVHYVQATINTWVDWDWEGGEAAFKRALEINPNYPEALVYYSNLLCYLGRPDEALAQGARAMELDPFNSVNMVIYGTTLAMLGKYEEAIVQHQNALKTSLNDPVARSSLLEIAHFQGRYDEALVEAKAFFTGLDMAPLVEIMEQGYEKEGYSGAMRLVAETMEAFSQEAYVSPWYIAYFYGFAGEKEKTLEWLEKAYEQKDPMMPYIGYVGVLQRFLLEDPHFQDLLRRMNLPDVNNLLLK